MVSVNGEKLTKFRPIIVFHHTRIEIVSIRPSGGGRNKQIPDRPWQRMTAHGQTELPATRGLKASFSALLNHVTIFSSWLLPEFSKYLHAVVGRFALTHAQTYFVNIDLNSAFFVRLRRNKYFLFRYASIMKSSIYTMGRNVFTSFPREVKPSFRPLVYNILFLSAR